MAIVTDVGTGCGGCVSVARRATLMRTAKSCGPDAPTLASSLVESIREATVAKEPGHRGEHEGNRKAIAQGMPVETGEPVEDYRILCGHGCIGHPAFPAPSSWRVALRPLFFWGERTCKTRAIRAAGTSSHVRSPDEPTGRANTRPMTGSAIAGDLAFYPIDI